MSEDRSVNDILFRTQRESVLFHTGFNKAIDAFVAELEKIAISPIGGLGVGDEVKTVKLLYLEQIYETAKRMKGDV